MFCFVLLLTFHTKDKVLSLQTLKPSKAQQVLTLLSPHKKGKVRHSHPFLKLLQRQSGSGDHRPNTYIVNA